MACPTCDHTMHQMGCRVTDRPFFWCPRCGTAREGDAEAITPALVLRCRVFVTTLGPQPLAFWRTLGIAECLNLSQARSQ